jgi:hypothetical protein
VTDEQIEKVIEKAITRAVKRSGEETQKKLDVYDQKVSVRIDEAVARTSEETRRQFEIVAERLDHKMDVLFEGHINTNQRFDRLKVTVDAHEDRITDLEASKR